MRRSNGYALSLMIVVALSAVSGCNTSDFDMDLRQNQYGTSDAARGVLEKRPKPDSRGIITYPNYQVAIAKFGDTLEILANRIGVDAQSLANYNGVKTSETLRPGEVIALPGKIAEVEADPSKGLIDVAEIAESALDDPSPSSEAATPPKEQKTTLSSEPIRHK